MEMRHFRYFLTLAEELHFGRAAERLHMAQPPLSRQIRALERELGVALFERTKRKVQLTEAGLLFQREARGVVEQANRAALIARRAGRGEVGHLEVTYASSVPFTRLFPRIIREYRNAYPDVSLSLSEVTSARQIEGLVAKRIDIGFVRPPLRDQPKEVAVTTLLREPFYVALREDHPLAGAESIAPQALARERFVLFPRDIGTGLYLQTTDICRAAGFTPSVMQEAQQMGAIVGLVSAGLGIAFAPACVRSVAADGVVYVPLRLRGEMAQVALAYRKDETSPPARAFVEIASRRAASENGSRPAKPANRSRNHSRR